MKHFFCPLGFWVPPDFFLLLKRKWIETLILRFLWILSRFLSLIEEEVD
ncbi:hypothetical protein LEP1GSC082_1830 [Leptospira kirschneri str. H2]|nr:hypothetical protein LEP1GSC082_1830 [Leptospira kirschneri str. H2]